MVEKFSGNSGDVEDIMKWKRLYGASCPICGSSEVEYDSGTILTSYPPQHNCRCKDCGERFFSGSISSWTNSDSLDMETPWKFGDPMPGAAPMIGDFPNSPYLGGNQGWICPKCGRVMAPHMDYCKFCCSSNELTINTNKLDENDKFNLVEKLVEDWKSTTPNDPFTYKI